MGPASIRMPERAKRGEVIEIRAMVKHSHESGFRHDNVGKPIPRHIVEEFVCTYDGAEVFRVKLHPAVASNPYFAFHVLAQRSGEFVFHWRDDRGAQHSHTQRLEVE